MKWSSLWVTPALDFSSTKISRALPKRPCISWPKSRKLLPDLKSPLSLSVSDDEAMGAATWVAAFFFGVAARAAPASDETTRTETARGKPNLLMNALRWWDYKPAALPGRAELLVLSPPA